MSSNTARKDVLYEIQYTKAAEKFMRNREDVRTEYENAIHELLIGEHPESINIKRITGKHAVYYRIRLGNYRVVYTTVNEMIVVICTILAGPRGDVYKKMSGLK